MCADYSEIQTQMVRQEGMHSCHEPTNNGFGFWIVLFNAVYARD